MVSFLDVICAIFQGQNSNIQKLVQRYQLEQCILRILQCNNFKDPVHQSAMANLGFICDFVFDSVQDKLTDILPIIEQMLDHKVVTVKNQRIMDTG